MYTVTNRITDIQTSIMDTYMEIKSLHQEVVQLKAERDSLAEQVKHLEAELMRREGVA